MRLAPATPPTRPLAPSSSLRPPQLRVAGPYNSAALTRANLLACNTIVHVIDSVLLPARSLQTTLPYDLALGGIASGGGGSGGGAGGGAGTGSSGASGAGSGQAGQGVVAATALGGRGSGGSSAGNATAGAEVPECYPSIADAIAATPQLSILRSTLGLSGVRTCLWEAALQADWQQCQEGRQAAPVVACLPPLSCHCCIGPTAAVPGYSDLSHAQPPCLPSHPRPRALPQWNFSNPGLNITLFTQSGAHLLLPGCLQWHAHRPASCARRAS